MNSEFYSLIYAYLYVVLNVRNRISYIVFGLTTSLNKTQHLQKKSINVIHSLINAHILLKRN